MAKQKSTKKKKKKWYPIDAPKMFRNAVIGECYVDDINSVKDKKLKVNLMSVTKNMKNQNVNVSFLINEIKGNSVGTELIGYEILPSYVKKSVKKGKTKVFDSFTAQSSDGVKVVVKPLLVTKGAVNKSVASSLRKGAKELIINYLSKNKYEKFAGDVVSQNLQKEMKTKLTKIYPLNVSLIKAFKKF